MEPKERFNFLIEKAIAIAGSQRKVAATLNVNPAHLIEMKQGKRKPHWKIIAGLRTLIGENPAIAYTEELQRDLEGSPKEFERSVAKQLAQDVTEVLKGLPDFTLSSRFNRK